VIVHRPSKPVPQSEVLVQVAVTAAADAGSAVSKAPVTAAVSATASAMARRPPGLDMVLRSSSAPEPDIKPRSPSPETILIIRKVS
jgi:hypothetical protein